MERGADVPVVVREESRLLRQLPEIRIPPAGVDANVGEVARDDGESDLARESGLVHHTREPHVVDPHFERVGRQNRVGPGADGKAEHSDSQLLNRGKVWRTRARIERVDDISIVAGRVARGRGRTRGERSIRDQDGIQAGAGVALRPLQIRVLNPRSQREQPAEAHVDLRQPRGLRCPCVDRRAIHVEVVVVARDFDVELELAIQSPAAAHASSPEPELLVAHEVLFAFGKSEIRFRPV